MSNSPEALSRKKIFAAKSIRRGRYSQKKQKRDSWEKNSRYPEDDLPNSTKGRREKKVRW